MAREAGGAAALGRRGRQDPRSAGCEETASLRARSTTRLCLPKKQRNDPLTNANWMKGDEEEDEASCIRRRTTAGQLQHARLLKQRRAARRQRTAQVKGSTTPLRASQGKLTLLEEKHPKEPTRKDYSRRLTEFLEFSRVHELSLETTQSLDEALCDFADTKYLEGEQCDCGTKLLAAVTHHWHQFGRRGSQRLPRFQRVLRSWRRVAPTATRDPIAWLVCCGLIGALTWKGWQEEALFITLIFDTYLRFTEAHDLQGGDLLKPAPRVAAAFRHWAVRIRPEEKEEPTKGGQFDDVLKLDSPDMKFLGPALHRLRVRQGDKARLFSFSPSQMRDRWAWAQKALGIEHMNYCIHQTRHGGASRDAEEKRRTREAIQKRGRWKSAVMLNRYEKNGRLQKSFEGISDATLDWCEFCKAHLDSLLRGCTSRLPRPPGL